MYGQISTDISSSDGRNAEIPSLCSNCLVCILAAAAGMHWELNHRVPPLCFAGLAELCDVVSLPVSTKTRRFSARLDLPAVPCCERMAAGHVPCLPLLRAELREAVVKGGSCFH